MISLPEYIKRCQESLSKFGGDPNVCLTAGASTAMITCYNVMCTYASIRKIKDPPTPISVISKTSYVGDSFTSISFTSSSINLNSLNKAINGYPNVNVNDYLATINLEIYC